MGSDGLMGAQLGRSSGTARSRNFAHVSGLHPGNCRFSSPHAGQRVVQDEVETALAQKLIAGEVRDRAHLAVDAGPDGLRFSIQQAPEAADARPARAAGRR